MELFELDVDVMAHQVMSDNDMVAEAQQKLAEKTAALKILPPKLSGEAGSSMYKEGIKKARASSKRQKQEQVKAPVEHLSKIRKAVEQLSKENKSYLEKFLGDGTDAENMINHFKSLGQVRSQMPLLPGPGASASEAQKDREND